jgi:hypothetical protein
MQAGVIQRPEHSRGCPKLLQQGALPDECRAAAGDATHYMIIQPVGLHLSRGSRVDEVLHTLQDVLYAIDALARLEIVHRFVATRAEALQAVALA